MTQKVYDHHAESRGKIGACILETNAIYAPVIGNAAKLDIWKIVDNTVAKDVDIGVVVCNQQATRITVEANILDADIGEPP